MDTDITHAAQAIFDDHEARLTAIEDHLGIGPDDEDTEDEGTEDDEDSEDGE